MRKPIISLVGIPEEEIQANGGGEMAMKTTVHIPGHVPCWWQREQHRPCSQRITVVTVVCLGLSGGSLRGWLGTCLCFICLRAFSELK